MTNEELKNRTKSFALRIIKLAKSHYCDDTDRILIRQLVRCSSSVAANYRAALKAKSSKDFCYKINIVEEEADESFFWLKLLADAEILKRERIALLIQEAKELTAIFTAQGRTDKSKL